MEKFWNQLFEMKKKNFPGETFSRTKTTTPNRKCMTLLFTR